MRYTQTGKQRLTLVTSYIKLNMNFAMIIFNLLFLNVEIIKFRAILAYKIASNNSICPSVEAAYKNCHLICYSFDGLGETVDTIIKVLKYV